MLNASRQALFYVKKKNQQKKENVFKWLGAKGPGGLEIGRDVRAGAVDRHECAAMISPWSASYELSSEYFTTHFPIRRWIGRTARPPWTGFICTGTCLTLISRRAALVPRHVDAPRHSRGPWAMA